MTVELSKCRAGGRGVHTQLRRYNRTNDIADLLRSLDFDTPKTQEHNCEFPAIEWMIERRPPVHRDDRLEPASAANDVCKSKLEQNVPLTTLQDTLGTLNHHT
jgi:hypothetical protein